MDFASDRGADPQPNQEIRRRGRNEEPARKTRFQARMTSSMGCYAELQCQSAFSFLRGASEPETLVERAVELGYGALALTDRDGLYGNPRFHAACKTAGLHAVHGTTLTLRRRARRALDCDGSPATADDRVVLLAQDDAGWSALCRLVSVARGRSRTEPFTPTEALGAEARGLLALAGPHLPEETVALLREAFGRERLFLSIHDRLLHRDRRGQQLQQARAARYRLEAVVTGGVRFARRQDKPVHDVLACVRHGLSLDEAATRLLPNAEFCLRPPAELERLFRHAPGALRRGAELAERCTFSMDRLAYRFPPFPVPDGQTPFARLEVLVADGTPRRYRPVGEAQRCQLQREMDLIRKLDLAGYFLLVHDIVHFCEERDILCQGRGSAANSAVCYVLGITSVDPVGMGLLFERFLSENRGEMPDIDIDIEHARREEVIQYVYGRYGRDRAALCGEVISYRARSAVRDAGKALGLSVAEVEQLAGHLDRRWDGDSGALPPEWARRNDPRLAHLLRVAAALCGLPRHIATHVGGMVITGPPLTDVMPVEPAAMENRTIVPWDKDDLAALGILKIDLLGLGMLTALAHTFRLAERFPTGPPGVPAGEPLRLHTVPADDAPTWDMLQAADTVGVFQVESRAQMNCLPRLRPATFYDLVVEVALIRPGPIQGDMVHPYLRRRAGREAVEYAHPSLEPILRRTLGVPLFQEQGMRIAMEVAGLSGSDADELRRAMGHKRSHARMEALSQRLIDGLRRHGLSPPAAAQVCAALKSFADFGFPESHSASFARLAWASSWLKRHYPAHFLCALLNSQPMGFYPPAVLVSDAQRHGVLVLQVDVLQSEWECALQWVEAGAPAEREKLARPGVAAAEPRGDPAPAIGAGAGSSGAPDGSHGGVEESRSLASAGVAPEEQSAPDARRYVPLGGDLASVAAAPAPVEGRWNPPRAPRLGVRLGLRLVRGIGAAHEAGVRAGLASVAERGPFVSPEDFARRTGLPAHVLEHLARLGALSGFEARRRHALWLVARMARRAPGPLAEPLPPEGDVTLPPLSEEEAVREGYRMAGVSVERHPLELLRPRLHAAGVLPAAELLQRGASGRGREAWVAGLAVCRQRPTTAGGLTFVSLEDETGFANLIVTPDVAARDREGLLAMIMLGIGRVEFADGVVNVKAMRLISLDDGRPIEGVPRHDYR
jgi:error-prone DNA polymerase